MDFIAFLVQKLRQNKQILIREIPTNLLGNSGKTWSLLGHNFGTRNSRKLIKGSKDSCYSLESKTNFEPQYRFIVWAMTS